MSLFCFASFVKTIKNHAKNKKISNENLIGELFCTICDVCEITNKNGDNYWSSKEIASLLVNRKEDVPAPIRQALLNADVKILARKLKEFYDDLLNSLEILDLIETLKILYKNDDHYGVQEIQELDTINETYELITYLLIETAKVNNKVIEKKTLIHKNGNSEINFVVDDIIKIGFNHKTENKNKIVVIPVDADFHMHVSKLGESPVEVSENTIHGKRILRMNQKGYSEADIIKLISNKKDSNENNIGNIATIIINKTEFYLLAVSKFDGDNVAHATQEEIKEAIKCLLKHYDKYGNGYDMYIPLVGTGLSRAKLSHNESYQLIKQTLLHNSKYLNGVINIVIYHRDKNYLEEL